MNREKELTLFFDRENNSVKLVLILIKIKSMAHTLDSDEYGIIEAMREDGSFVDGDHIVYKQYENHGEKYLDKDAHLKQE